MRIHATNIAGAGAMQLFRSLLPELIDLGGVDAIYVSEQVAEAAHQAVKEDARITLRVMRRHLPKPISRVLETTIFSRQYRGHGTLLVLGDIPLFGVQPQVVLVHSPFILRAPSEGEPRQLKYKLARAIFAVNEGFVSYFIVQSELMRSQLEALYPSVKGRVRVVAQPPPYWLLDSKLTRTGRVNTGKLSLIYPAAGYPHKNHRLVMSLLGDGRMQDALERVVLTIDCLPSERTKKSDFVQCVGLLAPGQLLAHYAEVDALLFLSMQETYGFPLLEAMWIGLPIVCPDLPYARAMCGSEAIYFEPSSSVSLLEALLTLRSRLANGWWPDWTPQLKSVPSSWRACAQNFAALCSPGRS